MKNVDKKYTVKEVLMILAIAMMSFVLVDSLIRMDDSRFDDNLKVELAELKEQKVIEGYSLKKDRKNVASFDYQLEIYRESKSDIVIIKRYFGSDSKVNISFE